MSERPAAPRVLAAVFARGGSKGLPRKNLQRIGGRTLIECAVDAARASGVVDRLIISTDDEEMAQNAKARGAEVAFMRPAELARDEAPEWLSWQHAARWWLENGGSANDILCCVPPTGPLRSPSDIAACVDALRAGDHDIVLTVTEAARHPSFSMVRFVGGTGVALVDPPAQALHRRQDTNPVYDITPLCYAARMGFILRGSAIFSGRVGAVVVPRERAIDIDTAFDLRIARCIAADAAESDA